MNKEQFLAAIRARLETLPPSDVETSLDYYSEMIDDRTEDGLSEEEAVAAMGSVDDIAAQILMDTPLPTLVKARMKTARSLRVWEIILLVLGSPVWLPLLLAAGIIVLSLYLVLWAVIASLYAADLGIAVGALGGIAGFPLFLSTGVPTQAALFLSAGLICAGLAILLFLLFNQFARAAVFLSKLPIRWLKKKFTRKEDAQ